MYRLCQATDADQQKSMFITV